MNKTFKNHKVVNNDWSFIKMSCRLPNFPHFLEESTNFLFFAASFELETTFTGNTEVVGLPSLKKDFWLASTM